MKGKPLIDHNKSGGTRFCLNTVLSRGLLIALIILTFFLLPFMPRLFYGPENYGLPSKRPAPGFVLQDAQNKAVSLADFQGKYIYLMFGYLHCRDVCHSQALVFQEISQRADKDIRLNFLYIAMDPERDTAEQLAAYFDSRGTNFTSLHSEDIHLLQTLAGEYRTFFSREGGPSSRDYEIQHTGLYFLIGPDGNTRYTYTANQNSVERILGDLTRIQQQ